MTEQTIEQLRQQLAEKEAELERGLNAIDEKLSMAYKSVHPVCCGRRTQNGECCGCPEQEWDERAEGLMSRLVPIRESLRSSLAALASPPAGHQPKASAGAGSDATLAAENAELRKKLALWQGIASTHDYNEQRMAEELERVRTECEKLRKDAERYRWLRIGNIDDIAVVRGLGAMDYGMSAVIGTYSEEIDGEVLDAAIDAAMEGENERD